MKRAIDETNRRRSIQNEYNVAHGITPKTIDHDVENTLEITKKGESAMSIDELEREIDNVTARMKTAANQLDFERAIQLREQVSNLTKLERLKKKKSRK